MPRTKYDPDTTPLLVKGWAREGLFNKQIAKNLRIARQTLNIWIKKYPELSEALKCGQAPVDFEVENLLLDRCRGREWIEERVTTEDVILKGKVVRLEKRITISRIIPSDVTAIIFWLKMRKPDQWQRGPVVEGGGEVIDPGIWEEEVKALRKRDGFSK